jgi:hypothetical protein
LGKNKEIAIRMQTDMDEKANKAGPTVRKIAREREFGIGNDFFLFSKLLLLLNIA